MPSSAPRHKPMPRLARRHEVPGAADKYGQGRGGRPWRRLRAAILLRDQYMCQCPECNGAGLLAHEVDHIIPIAKGGTDEPSNLQAINRDCHKRKSAVDAGAKPSRLERRRLPGSRW